MSSNSERYRREAELVEEMVKNISFRPHKEALLAEADSLRRRAEELEEGSDTVADWVDAVSASTSIPNALPLRLP